MYAVWYIHNYVLGMKEQRRKTPDSDGWWKVLVGEVTRRDTGKDFWELVTLNLNSKDEQELV